MSINKPLNRPYIELIIVSFLAGGHVLLEDIPGVGKTQFRPGPLFSSIILADEINRATPRTQSSLLEAMEEKQVTADGETRILNTPFMVLATQPCGILRNIPITRSPIR